MRVLKMCEKNYAADHFMSMLANIAARNHYENPGCYTEMLDYERLRDGDFNNIRVKYLYDFKECPKHVFKNKMQKGTDCIKVYMVELYFDSTDCDEDFEYSNEDKFMTLMFVDNAMFNFVGLYAMNCENDSILLYGTQDYHDRYAVIDKLNDELMYIEN